jgi:hypothetical protein
MFVFFSVLLDYFSFSDKLYKFTRQSQGLTPNTPMSLIQAVSFPDRGKFSSMESLISHFRLTSEG